MVSSKASGSASSTSRRRNLDFGTYHHMTHWGSEEARRRLRPIFIDTFRRLPFLRDQRIKVLDVGCGLGFLSCLCAEFYPNAFVTGVDTFEHPSLRGASIEGGRENARILGFSERIQFRQRNILESDFRRDNFDLFVSNLVYHNLGRKRFAAYERLASWVPKGAYVVLGELFFGPRPDLKHLSLLFGSVKKVPTRGLGSPYKLLIMSDPKWNPPHRD